ncbi:MAG TPA: glycosyltransferase [Acetobacteraceae bacterium]|nr:glycosyltransferase [Acetobacteraceae bacterium]
MALDLPARDMLQLEGQTAIAWAVFDPVWYLQSYPEISEALPDRQPATILAWHLEHGQTLGHAPGIFFDEAWHRHAYPAIGAMLRDGRVASAFDAYCRGGHARSPHWLFDESYYRRRYPDLTDDALQANGLANGYDHYLRHGAAEARVGHPLFDPRFYRGALEPEGAALAEQWGPFRHYLRRIAAPVPEPRTSPYFDPAWYLRRYPHVAEELAAGKWRCALQHYLCNDTPTGFDPLPQFSEAFYLARNAGVAEAVQRGERRNGYAHYLAHGAFEQRAPCEAIDLRWYASQPQVLDDLERGRAAHGFEHWLLIGRHQGLLAAPPPEERLTEGQASTVFRRKAQFLAPLLARAPLDFTCAGKPVVSVVMVLHDQLSLTLATLASLRANLPGDVELILVDSGSADETRHIARYVLGAQVMRFDTDIGPLRGSNAGLPCIRAGAALLLHNDVELAPGAVAAALRCLDSDPRIGAVGGKMISAHGLLHEAGGIVWRDGTIQAYQRDASPLLPEANFRRDADFCSGVCLMVRTALLQQLDGFDDAYAPGSYADVDLCARIQQSGFRVVYDPAVSVYHMADGSTPPPGEADIAPQRLMLCRKHEAWLRQRPVADPAALVVARHGGAHARRALFIEDMLPLRWLGSGFVRSNDLIRTMAAMGYDVTVYPVAPSRFDLAAVYADMPDTAEVMHDRGIDGLRDFLQHRQGYYDAVWIARTHNLDRLRPILERAFPDHDRRPRIVLDSEAIAALRQAQKAVLAGEAAVDLDAAIRHEFANADFCQNVVAVNATEARMLRDLGCQDVTVIGHMRAPRPTPRSFDKRAGMLFVGAMHQPDSPNYDSLCWFVDAVLPLIERELRWETRLTVVGYTTPDVVLDRFRQNPRITLRGALGETEQLYDSHRLFVAPTRIAAGTPYKVHEAASFGLPVVATELLRRQLGWEDGRDLLVAPAADPALFARQVVRLYRDPALWQSLRDAALERLRQDNSAADYAAAVESVLGPADAPSPAA